VLLTSSVIDVFCLWCCAFTSSHLTRSHFIRTDCDWASLPWLRLTGEFSMTYFILIGRRFTATLSWVAAQRTRSDEMRPAERQWIMWACRCQHVYVVYAGVCLEWFRTTFTVRCCLVLAALLSCFCRSVHLAVSAISTTPTSVLPMPFVWSTRSCEIVLDTFWRKSDDWLTRSLLVFLYSSPVEWHHRDFVKGTQWLKLYCVTS